MKTVMMPSLIAIASLISMNPALAGNDTPLYRAACEFREVAEEFEDVVDDSRYSSRLQRDLADDFEDAVSDLRNRARRPHRRTDLIEAWHETQLLRSRVEAVIFGNPNCPSRAKFLPCWRQVICASNRFEQQLALLPPCGGDAIPGIGHGHPFNVQPPIHQRPIIEPPVRDFRRPIQPIIPPSQAVPATPAIPSWYRQAQPPRSGVGITWGRPSWDPPGFHYRSRSQGSFRVPSHDPRSDAYQHLRNRTISPSERQLNDSTRHLYRQPSVRQLDVGTIGALISRLID